MNKEPPVLSTEYRDHNINAQVNTGGSLSNCLRRLAWSFRHFYSRLRLIILPFLSIVILALTGCQASHASPVIPSHTPSLVEASKTPTVISTLTPTITPSPSPTLTLTPTSTPTITFTPQPFGCLEPPDDYERVLVNGWLLNRRTLAMLEHAEELYGGEIEISGYAITQGSFNDNGAASFGTHLGGGAVDLSVIRKGTWQVLWDEIEPLIRALRAAGFAAWLRDLDELYPGSPIHIHAIAIGDRELSQAAQEQLTGPRGYFYGFTGIPYGEPELDRHGGPVVCQWMIDLGYSDLRDVINP